MLWYILNRIQLLPGYRYGDFSGVGFQKNPFVYQSWWIAFWNLDRKCHRVASREGGLGDNAYLRIRCLGGLYFQRLSIGRDYRELSGERCFGLETAQTYLVRNHRRMVFGFDKEGDIDPGILPLGIVCGEQDGSLD